MLGTDQNGSKVQINDKTLSDFKDISTIDKTLPLIAVVGHVDFQKSITDLAVYGVTTDYLKQSAIKPVVGKVFESNQLTIPVSNSDNQVKGATVESTIASSGEKIQSINYLIEEGTWIKVREKPSTSSNILGYTKRSEGNASGQEVWGGTYKSDNGAGSSGETEDGSPLGKWVQAPMNLWKVETCDSQTNPDCIDNKYLILRDNDSKQIQKDGYIAEISVTVSGTDVSESSVLGVKTDKNSDNSSLEWVEIASESASTAIAETKKVELNPNISKETVVNRATLSVLGIKENEAIGKKIIVSFVVVGDLLSDYKEKVESVPTEYTIIGVTPDEKTPILYVPFVNLRSLGIVNYSQTKIVIKDKIDLAKTRRQIESMGYETRSVADTVDQINSLFATARTILLLLGMVALAVAALGMFNTLTVSLLERTREVGLMKAMGMKSFEVQELFLTESMIMGVLGGFLGIVFGFITGKILGFFLSLFTLFKGIGFIDISYLPFPFVIMIIFLSLLVGIGTGIYPAKRATKISALNALRYE